MEYKNRKDYVADCILAAVGTALSEDYSSKLFEDVIDTSSPDRATCAKFICFVKSTADKKYITRSNFNNFLLEKSGKEVILDEENSIAEVIFDRLETAKENNYADLRDPKQLFSRLYSARRKLKLFESINGLLDNDNFSTDAVTWSDRYCETLQKSLEDATSEYSENPDDVNVLFTGEDIQEYYETKLQERKNGEVYSFHNRIFDELVTEGPTPGHGGILGGSTGMGKSTLCLNLVNDLINADVPVIYCPIEMGLENTIDRLVSLRTGYPYKEIVRIGKTKEPTTDLESEILHEIKGISTHPNFAILNRADINMRNLKSYVQQFQAKLPGRKYCIVIIDLLLMVQDFYDVSGGNMAQMIEKAINKLDILAKELNFHWIGVVQLGRAAEQDKVLSEQSIDKLKPTRSSIKNSNALLERSRYCLTIFRKKFFADVYLSKEESEGIEDICEISLLKANSEEIGKRYANFDGATFRITYNEVYGKSTNGF